MPLPIKLSFYLLFPLSFYIDFFSLKACAFKEHVVHIQWSILSYLWNSNSADLSEITYILDISRLIS